VRLLARSKPTGQGAAADSSVEVRDTAFPAQDSCERAGGTWVCRGCASSELDSFRVVACRW